MKVIFAPEEAAPAVKMECDCGTQFWVDPADEENLVWDGNELIEVCPKCGVRNERNRKIIYLDGVDYQHEIGQAAGGNRIYATLEDLKKNNSCWEGCGVVEAEVILRKWVVNQDFDKSKSATGEQIDAELKEKGVKQIQLEHLERLRAYYATNLAALEKRIAQIK